MTPAERHTAVLAGLAKLSGALVGIEVTGHQLTPPELGVLNALVAGNWQILQRHAPVSTPGWDGCDATGERWPCSDYRDAAAGFLDQGAA